MALKALAARPIPASLVWQRQLARRLPEDALLELARRLLEWGFAKSSASLLSASLTLTVRAPRGVKAELLRMRACDDVAQRAPQRHRAALELMCDAALQGELDLAWLEWPMRACIRLNFDRPARQARLRAFYQSEPFDAPLKRVAKLYTPIIQAEHLSRRGHVPRHVLLAAHAARLMTSHPRRAQHLLELALIVAHRVRAFTLTTKLRRALARHTELSVEELARDPIAPALAKLYLAHHAIEPARVAFVKHLAERTPLLDDVSPESIHLFMLIGDYDRAFDHLTCSYEGASIQHADKDAATRVTYYIERHPSPRLKAQIFDLTMAPVEWARHTFSAVRPLVKPFDSLWRFYNARLMAQDQSPRALKALSRPGSPRGAERFAQIAELALGPIEAAARARRARAVALAAALGGLSALTATLGSGAAVMIDAPLMLLLIAHICHDLCWLYGFVPSKEPQLLDTILHVALWGPKPQVRQSHREVLEAMRELALRKALLTGAITRGAISPSGLHLIGAWFDTQVPSGAALRRAVSFARDLVARTPTAPARALGAPRARALPMLGATLGATLNATFIGDLFDAAQAVLADRFLDRKYPNWPTHFTLTSA